MTENKFLKEEIKTLNIDNFLKNYNLIISNNLKNLFLNNINVILKINDNINKTREPINNVLLTTAFLEHKRTNKDILLIANKEGFIEKVLYNNKIDLIDDIKNKKLFLINNDDNKMMVLDENRNNIINDISIIKTIQTKYKGEKQYINFFKDFNKMNDIDFKLTLAYLWGSRTELNTTGVGAVIYDKNDHLITDGYNALRSEYKSDILKLMMHLTEVIDQIPDNVNKEELIKEIYSFREKLNYHAEINAIKNVERLNVDIKDSSIYLNFHPCINCAKKVINSGIKNIILDQNFKGNQPEEQLNWKKSIEESSSLLINNKIPIKKYEYTFNNKKNTILDKVYEHSSGKFKNIPFKKFKKNELYILKDQCYYGKKPVTTDEYNSLTYIVDKKRRKKKINNDIKF